MLNWNHVPMVCSRDDGSIVSLPLLLELAPRVREGVGLPVGSALLLGDTEGLGEPEALPVCSGVSAGVCAAELLLL